MDAQYTPFVIIAGIIALLVGIVMVQRYFENKRTLALQEFASSRGYEFAGTDIALLQRPYRAISHGRGHAIANVIRGVRNGVHFVLCDLRYVTGSGRSKQTHLRQMCFLSSPGRGAPQFFARRERALLDALGKVFGGKDINFDEDPEFSKAYVLQGSDEDAVRRFMTVARRAELSRLADRKMTFETIDNQLLVECKRLKSDQLESLVNDTIALADRLLA